MKHGSGALIDWYWEYWLSCDVGQLRGLSQEGYCWTTWKWIQNNSLYSWLSWGLRINSCIKHCSKCNNSKVSNKVSSKQSLVRFAPPCADSGSGSVSRSKSSTSQSNLGGYERFGKASTVEEHRGWVRILGATHRELRREHTPWSERRLDVGRGKRIGNSDRSECGNGSCDASGHSTNAGRPTVHIADDPCGRKIVRHPRGLWIWRRSGCLTASSFSLGPLDDWKRKRISQRNPFLRRYQAGRAARSSGTTGGLDEALHAKKRRTEWSAPYVVRRHQVGGVGSASSWGTRATLSTPTVTVGYVSKVERSSCSLRWSKRVRCTQAGSSVEGSRRQRRPYGCWRIRTTERTKFFPKERERFPLALAKEREQEKMEKMVRNHQDERTPRNSRSVLELRENRSSI